MEVRSINHLLRSAAELEELEPLYPRTQARVSVSNPTPPHSCMHDRLTVGSANNEVIAESDAAIPDACSALTADMMGYTQLTVPVISRKSPEG